MDTRLTDTAHLSHNASENTHLPADFSGPLVTCKGCDFLGDRWEFRSHLHDLGVCWSCYGLGVFKFRTIPGRSYDHACTKCGGTGTGDVPPPPRPKDHAHGPFPTAQ